jgi:hypothetical protein
MFQHLNPFGLGQRFLGKCGKQIRIRMARPLIRRLQTLPN